MSIFNGKASASETPGPQQSSELPTDGTAANNAESKADERRRLVLLGGVAGVAVLGAVGYFVVVPALSGSSTPASTPVVTHHVAAASTPTKAPAKSPASTPKATSVPSVSASAVQLATGRDPFVPLVTAAPAVTSVPVPSSGATSSPSTSASNSTTSTSSPGATPSPTSTPVS